MVLESGYTQQIQSLIDRIAYLYEAWFDPFRPKPGRVGPMSKSTNIPNRLYWFRITNAQTMVNVERRVQDNPGKLLRSVQYVQAIQDWAWGLLDSPVIRSELLGPSPTPFAPIQDSYVHSYYAWAQARGLQRLGYYSVSDKGLGIDLPYSDLVMNTADIHNGGRSFITMHNAPRSWVQSVVEDALGIHQKEAQRRVYSQDAFLGDVDTLITAIENALPDSIPYMTCKVDISATEIQAPDPRAHHVSMSGWWQPSIDTILNPYLGFDYSHLWLRVDWGDGQITGEATTHNYSETGTYTISFQGVSREPVFDKRQLPNGAYDISPFQGVYCAHPVATSPKLVVFSAGGIHAVQGGTGMQTLCTKTGHVDFYKAKRGVRAGIGGNDMYSGPCVAFLPDGSGVVCVDESRITALMFNVDTGVTTSYDLQWVDVLKNIYQQSGWDSLKFTYASMGISPNNTVVVLIHMYWPLRQGYFICQFTGTGWGTPTVVYLGGSDGWGTLIGNTSHGFVVTDSNIISRRWTMGYANADGLVHPPIDIRRWTLAGIEEEPLELPLVPISEGANFWHGLDIKQSGSAVYVLYAAEKGLFHTNTNTVHYYVGRYTAGTFTQLFQVGEYIRSHPTSGHAVYPPMDVITIEGDTYIAISVNAAGNVVNIYNTSGAILGQAHINWAYSDGKYGALARFAPDGSGLITYNYWVPCKLGSPVEFPLGNAPLENRLGAFAAYAYP